MTYRNFKMPLWRKCLITNKIQWITTRHVSTRRMFRNVLRMQNAIIQCKIQNPIVYAACLLDCEQQLKVCVNFNISQISDIEAKVWNYSILSLPGNSSFLVIQCNDDMYMYAFNSLILVSFLCASSITLLLRPIDALIARTMPLVLTKTCSNKHHYYCCKFHCIMYMSCPDPESA